MARGKTITQEVESVCIPFGMPRLEIPPDACLNDRGFCIQLEIDTNEGTVKARVYQLTWYCRGTAAALIAAGLARSEWFPGLPGNAKSRQTVFFESSGPRLATVKRPGKQFTEPHIAISRRSARTFMVEINTTDEQRQHIKHLRDQQKALEDAQKSAQFLANREEENRQKRLSKKSGEMRKECIFNVDLALRVFVNSQGGVGVRYSDEVVREVNQHFAAARQALLVGKILPKSAAYACEGNVTYLPVSATPTLN